MQSKSWVAWLVLALITESASADTAKSAAKPAKAPAAAKPEAVLPEATGEDAGSGQAFDDALDPWAKVPHVIGPKLVDLGHGAEIELPAGLELLEREAARDNLEKAGDPTAGIAALIIRPGGPWIVGIYADDVGYVSDDDSDRLDADDLMRSFREGTVEQNKKRLALGVPDLIIDRWSEPPRYLAAEHHLVWGIEAHDINGKVINFDTRILGRDGYLSFRLIADPEILASAKLEVAPLLKATRFKAGHRYEDHRDGDRDSGMGLRSLVLGGTGLVLAHKTGILVAILLALKKAFLVVAIAIGGFFKWLLGRKKRGAEAPPTDVADPPAPAG